MSTTPQASSIVYLVYVRMVVEPRLQAEHLASRPGYLALAVDGATPGPGLAACSVGAAFRHIAG